MGALGQLWKQSTPRWRLFVIANAAATAVALFGFLVFMGWLNRQWSLEDARFEREDAKLTRDLAEAEARTKQIVENAERNLAAD